MQKFLFHLNREPEVQRRWREDRTALLADYPLTDEERDAIMQGDVGKLYVLGCNGQLLMHFAPLLGLAWADYLQAMRDGTARRIIKAGQVFGRIHVDDIAQVLRASIRQPNPGAAYNVCDDNPCPPEEVLSYAARLLGLPEPPAVDFDTAEMTDMARSFYGESKRTRNDRIKAELGVTLLYPDYPAGLQALLAKETASSAAPLSGPSRQG